ncbi:MAG: hypothetical protein ABI813_14905 [Bacteroidota bacterium]
MQKEPLFTNQAYLNRLALSMDDTNHIDPYWVITDFFCFGSLAEMKERLEKTCKAALVEKYNWKQGCPGNLLYFYERLEKLVEACFLITSSSKYKNRLVKKAKQGKLKEIESNPLLPCSLSAAELNDPLSVLQSFFQFHDLKRWKQDIYAWMEAGLSDFTVLENIAPKNLITYHHHLQKLLDACWYINLLVNSKKT